MTMDFSDRQNRTMKAISAYAIASVTGHKEKHALEFFGTSLSDGKKLQASETDRANISFADKRQKAA